MSVDLKLKVVDVVEEEPTIELVTPQLPEGKAHCMPDFDECKPDWCDPAANCNPTTDD